MATTIGSLAVQITGNTSGLASALRTAGTQVQKFQTDMAKGRGLAGGLAGAAAPYRAMLGVGGSVARGALGGLTSTPALLGAAGVAGGAALLGSHVAGIVTDSVKIAANFEDLRTSFKVMLGDAEQAKALFADIQKFAAATPMTTGQLAESAKGLLGAGTAADQIIPTLRMLGDLALGDGEKLKSLVLVYGQVRGMGRLMGDDFKQFVQSGGLSGLGEALAQTLKVPLAQVRPLMEEGKVSFADLQRAMISMTSQGGRFFGGMAEGAKTFNGVVSTLKDNWELLLGVIGQAIIDEFGLKDVVTSLSALLEKGQGMGDQIRPLLRDLKDGAVEFGDALFTGLANSVVMAAQLVNWLNRVQKSLGIGDQAGRGPVEKLLDWQVEQGTIGGAFGLTEGPLNWVGPGGVAHALKRNLYPMLTDVTSPEGRPDDLIDVKKIAEKAKELAAALKEAIRGGAVEGGNWLAQSIERSLKGGSAAGVVPDREGLTANDLNRLKGLRADFDPVGAMRAELGELAKLHAKGGFANEQPGLFEHAAANVFNKFAKDIGDSAKLASAALKGSAEAVSAIARHRTGNQDPQARVVNVLEQMRELQRQELEAAREVARALAGKQMFVSVNPLRP